MIRSTFGLSPRPGDVIRGDIRTPEGPPPRSAVVLVHGFKGSKDGGFFPWLADRVAAAGHTVLTFNLSHNGIDTDPLQVTDLERFASNTLTLEQEDIRTLLTGVLDGDVLPRRPRKVALVGYGRGGAQTVLAAASEARVASLVTWTALSHFDRWTQETKEHWRAEGTAWVLDLKTGRHLPVGVGLLEDFERHRTDLDVRAAAKRVAAPWLIVHGADDMSVWPGEADLLARANPAARVHLVAGASHAFDTREPFQGPSASLCEAAERTLDHLAALLEESP